MCGRSRFLGVALLAAGLAGCVTYPSSYYAPGDPYAGGGDYYFDERYDDGYGGAYGYVEPYSSGYASGWPVYYSTLWPVYRNYYDPFWSPGFYYGVTWFPSTYFGLGIGGWDAWPYYTHYSPYRYAFWDSYYDWYNPWWHGGGHYGHGHGHGGGRGHRDDWDDRDDNGWRDPPRGGGGPRFGSARNEAERLARIDGVGASPGKVDGYGAYGNARGATGRNWRGTPPAGALSQSGNAGETPLSNADLLGRSRFASRPGTVPGGGAQPGYRDNAGTAPANPRGTRGEVQRPGSAPGYPAPDRANAYRQPRGSVPQAADPNSGWVGPTPGSRPTGRYEQRPYEQRAPAAAGQPAPRSYSRQMPQQDGYAPIEGSAGGSSRWRSAPSSAPAPATGQAWDRPSNAPRGYPQGRSGYPAQGRQPAPQADYPATRSQPSPRYESRPQNSGASQPRYQAPPQRYEAPPRREAPPPRQESRDRSDSDNDNGGGSSSESSRFSRGGRDRED